MNQQQVDLFLAVRGKYFQPEHLPYIREQLLATDESKAQALNYLDYSYAHHLDPRRSHRT